MGCKSSRSIFLCWSTPVAVIPAWAAVGSYTRTVVETAVRTTLSHRRMRFDMMCSFRVATLRLRFTRLQAIRRRESTGFAEFTAGHLSTRATSCDPHRDPSEVADVEHFAARLWIQPLR
jgi:hypothetical protein